MNDNKNAMELFSLLSSFFNKDKHTNKYFNVDGSPAKDIAEDRKDLIHIDEVMDSFANVTNLNTDAGTHNIEDANEPVKTTIFKDKYGLTEFQRTWLLEYIFCVEGGYFNHPNDPGGETMYGIIKTEARKWGYTGAMKNLPKEVAVDIYLKKYWAAFGLDKINDFKKALCIFDFLVNSGTRGITVAQRVVNKVVAVKSKLKTTAEKYKDLKYIAEDGKIGPKTIEAINKIDYREFLSMYFFLQEDVYEDLMRANTKLRSFDEGWENRIATKIIYLAELERLENNSGDTNGRK